MGKKALEQFESLGIAEIDGRMPSEMRNKYDGPLVLVASAACVWDDLERAGMAKNHDEFPHVMCINDMIMHYPNAIEHAYSNNHQYLSKWIEGRRDQFVNRWGIPKHTHSNQVGGKWTWPWPGHGTSSLNAVYTALAMGYSSVWVCGVPLDNSRHYFEPPWMKTNFANNDHLLRCWKNAQKYIFQDKVFSFSGNTRKLLGEPDR